MTIGPPPPLAGIRVLDASSVLSGPLTAMLLAELGAEVIKVENPAAPDFTRGTGSRRGGMTAYYYNTNRGKRSLAINGRHPEGQQILQTLVTTVDVVIQNMRPGKAAGIGLDPDECLALNPSLVYASISGYGADGPAAGEPVYDYVIQAVSGMVDLQRDPVTGRHDLARHFPADKTTSHATVEAILAALFARERDPLRRGQHVQVSMHEANLSYFWPDGMMQHTIVGQPDDAAMYPGDYYRVYPTTDGAIVLMPIMSPLESLCLAVDRPEWTSDPRWAPNLVEGDLGLFQDLLAAEIASRSTVDALAAFAAHDVPAGRVLGRHEVADHPQAVARESVRTVDAPHIGAVHVPRPAWRFETTPAAFPTDAPELGQHTRAILTDLGYDEAAIDRLVSEQVLLTNDRTVTP